MHFAGVAPQTDGYAAVDAHSHDAATEAHSHEDGGEGPTTFTRNAWTGVFSGLVYVAYALILIAGFGLARICGHIITAREGILWGIAGFVSFQLAPAMGLAPELPGTMAAELDARQLWWWGTVAATAGGLALIAYGRGALAALATVLLIATPHVVGAPELEGFSGVAPPEVAGAFAARVLGVGLAVWALMGWVAGFVWAKDAEKAARIR